MTQDQLNQNGYIIDGYAIEPITYREYLREYGADETTSPNGIAPRFHIRDRNEEFQIWSWGTGGNNPIYTGSSFEDEEDAVLFLYDCWRNYANTSNSNIPTFFGDYDEAVADLAETTERSEDVIERYQRFVKYIASSKEAARQAAALRMAELNKAVEVEAAGITPDQEFKEAVNMAYLLKGEEKTNALSSAFVSLLMRNGYGKITSDFWKVFKAVNKKEVALPNLP